MAHDACSEEWAARHVNDADARAYVGAWCRIRASDRGAIDALGRLAREARSEIAKPARLDVVNLLADWMDARHACAWLDSWSLGTGDTFDLLAGTYLALGMRDDAVVADQHAGPGLTDEVRCERYLAYGKLDDVELKARLLAVAGAKGGCGRLAAHLACIAGADVGYLGDDRCEPDTKNDRELAVKVQFAQYYLAWPQSRGWTFANLADVARELGGVEDVAVAALENAAPSAQCDARLQSAIRETADKLRASDAHSAQFDARLARLTAILQGTCP